MITRYQRKCYTRKKQYWIKVIITILAVIFILLYSRMTNYAIPVTAMSPFEPPDSHFRPQWHEILSLVIPGLQTVIEPPHPAKNKPQLTAQSTLRDVFLFFTEIDVRDVHSLFKAEIPSMALLVGPQHASAMSLPSLPKRNPPIFPSGGKPLVGIYHTHTSESFIPDSGVDHKPGGQRGDIVDVGAAMVTRFAEHGIPAIQSKNIHDYPSFIKAYDKSEITVRQMIRENPSLQALFDIHRNAGKREETTATVNGVPVARILIIVGKGQPGLEQPHWEQNYAFAKAIDNKLNQYYPGVSLGIDVVEWRYNQHLHPHALLFEMGCQYNTTEEVTRTIEMVADIVTEILAQ
jgi:stage II sporulation protein P